MIRRLRDEERTSTGRGTGPVGLWALLGLPMLLFLALPLYALLTNQAPANVFRLLADEESKQAMWLSLWTSGLTTGIVLVAGTPLAFLVARYRFPMRRAVDALIDLPVVLPPAVAGVALLLTFGRMGLLGGRLEQWGVSIAFSSTAVVMAQLFVASPFYLRSAIAAFQDLDPEVERSAALDGAKVSQVLSRVTFPLLRGPLLAGLLMAWARALGEFGATLLFAGNLTGSTQTVPLAIYLGFEYDLDRAVALSILLMTVAFAVLITMRLLNRHSTQSSR